MAEATLKARLKDLASLLPKELEANDTAAVHAAINQLEHAIKQAVERMDYQAARREHIAQQENLKKARDKAAKARARAMERAEEKERAAQKDLDQQAGSESGVVVT